MIVNTGKNKREKLINQIRVIAGKYKRKKLRTLPGTDITRPTSDRVKESIFNILQDQISDKFVLDLFSGSGALGIEALSRGAKKVVFVEENRAAAMCINENLDSIKPEKDSYQIYQNSVSNFLNSKKSKTDQKFDIIFADPPYATDWYLNALSEIKLSGVCNYGCFVIFEMPFHISIHEQGEAIYWERINERKYGKTKIEIWRYQNGEN